MTLIIMEDKALDLVLAVYRLTKLFPEGEVLTGQMRQTANSVLAELILGDSKKAVSQIKILLSYLRIAKEQSWTKRINFVILSNKYQELLNEVQKQGFTAPGEKTTKKARQKKEKGLGLREQKVLDFIKQKKLVQTKDLFSVFPKLNARTIRRDLKELVKKNLIFQKGKGWASVYRAYKTNEDKNRT